ncbi:glycoside hydrolase family 28 protein [Tamlana agarivorans]|uniref:Glycoside hydrolase family 28 protein n=1 Tax=Pseudotamlana agarivorans TaxID=481183 RepID=A0ACC5U9H9_9FLAO|nr:glycoside hydrolase family 28 protein [Tamlana agarivorans]MBU2950945.1 glycoside hydrolase family 28 protein [Tamlana agarivorans]
MKNLILSLFLLVCFGYGHAQFNQNNHKITVFNIKDFGAIGDSVTLDTKAIQKAIDACTAKGGGTVRVPAGKFQVGTIILKNNVTLSLDYGAYLLGSQNINDYDATLRVPREESNSQCLIYAEDATNITIEGLGVIDGRGTNKAFPADKFNKNARPRLIRMENCNQISLQGVTLKRPAFWGLHLIDCTNIHINNITIRFRNNNVNNDGIDIDGCQNVLIENCDIISGDDGICLKSSLNPCRNVIVRNCVVSSGTAPFKIGTSSRGGFMDVNVSNCYFYDCPMGALKIELVDGGRLENIDISRITMKNVGSPVFIRLGNRGRVYKNFKAQIQNADAKPEGAPIGSIKNVRISDIVAEVTIEDLNERTPGIYHPPTFIKEFPDQMMAQAGPIMITGIPDHYIENVTLENIDISFPGLGTKKHKKNKVAEDIARYPEQFFFGILPSWGAYIRHAKNITFKNVKMQTREADARDEIITDDVIKFVNN